MIEFVTFVSRNRNPQTGNVRREFETGQAKVGTTISRAVPPLKCPSARSIGRLKLAGLSPTTTGSANGGSLATSPVRTNSAATAAFKVQQPFARPHWSTGEPKPPVTLQG